MVRVLIEISLPAHTLLGVRQLLGPGALATGVIGHLEETGPRSPCAGPAQGGSCSWVPCWVSLHCEDPGAPGLDDAIQRLRAGLVRAAREGGLELLVVPAAVQLGDRYLRLRDVAEVPPMAAEDH